MISIYTHRRAFSLVELSIVLVILGLLVGGILAGQSLIRAAELRSVSTQYQRYQASLYAFRDKYFALPGDMTNATSFWGAAHATPATCRTTSSSTALTCDGDGNGQISTVDAGVTYSEYFHAWKQLANAGLIEGTYTGIKFCANVPCSQPGVNVPAARITNSGFSFASIPSVTNTSDANWFTGPYGNFLWFGGSVASDMSGLILRPEETWNMDTKLDDGNPSTGIVMTSKGGASACYVTSGSTYAYALGTTSLACHVLFMLRI